MTIINQNLIHKVRTSIFQLLLFTFVVFCGEKSDLRAQDNCDYIFSEARIDFNRGMLTKVIKKLPPCLETDVNKNEKIYASQILALAYIGEEQSRKARETIKKLLEIDYDYDAKQYNHPAQHSAQFQQYLDEIRRELPNPQRTTATRFFTKGYFLGISAGVALASVLILAL